METQWLRFHCPAFTAVVKVERADDAWLVVEGPPVANKWKGLDVQEMLTWARGKWGEAKVVEVSGV